MTKQITEFDKLPNSGYVRDVVVAGIFACSRATVWRRAKEEAEFPKPRKLGPRRTGWNVGELRAHLARLPRL
jgi:predicted DNA-binding transcriptional regulator AlpA